MRTANRWNNLVRGRGFTRIEPLVVIAIIGIFTSQIAVASELQFTDDDWVSMSPASIRITVGHSLDPTKMAANAQGHLYILGPFNAIGHEPADSFVTEVWDYRRGQGIAKWDGFSWSTIPVGMAGRGDDIAVVGDDLFLAASIDSDELPVPAHRVFRHDGASWSPVGEPFNAAVLTLASIGLELYAGGDFTSAGGIAANHIAKWDGHAWVPVGNGVNGSVLTLNADGDILYAGGEFTAADGDEANYIAKWDGSIWSSIGAGLANAVRAIAVSGQYVFAGGWQGLVGGETASRVARWNGESWTSLGEGVDGSVQALAVSGSDLFVGGSFDSAGGIEANRIAKWDGESWSALGAGIDVRFGFSIAGPGDQVGSLLVSPNGDLYVSGTFTSAGGVSVNSLAQWDGVSWSRVGINGAGFNGPVGVLVAAGQELYAGGAFTSANGTEARYLARWDGSSWSALGSGVREPVEGLAVSGSDIYAPTYFEGSDGSETLQIGKWDGMSWQAIGSGFSPIRETPLAASGTNLYAVGTITAMPNEGIKLAQWDGTSWQAVGSNLRVLGLTPLVFSTSKLYALGIIDSLASGTPVIAGYDGISWSRVAAPRPGERINTFVFLGTELYALLASNTPEGSAQLARWGATSWTPLGSPLSAVAINHTFFSIPGNIRLIAIRSNLFAVGSFRLAANQPHINIARWDGIKWVALGSGTDGPVYALAALSDTIYAGGEFTFAGGKVSANLARAFLDGAPPMEVRGVQATVFFRGLPKGAYRIDRTTQFTQWESMGIRWTGESGGIDFTDEQAPREGAYYRAVAVER